MSPPISYENVYLDEVRRRAPVPGSLLGDVSPLLSGWAFGTLRPSPRPTPVRTESLMRTAVKILSIVAAAACAVGVSACEDEVVQAGGGSTAPGQGAPAGAQAIEPITFTDEAIGLTETCDQIVPNFDAAQYKASSSAQDETVYLLHCTLDFSGNLSFDSETNHALNLVDDNDKHHHSYSSSSGVDDDMKQAGLDPISYDDYGTNHVDGWYAFTVWGKDGKADPLPEGATTLVYERESISDKGGKTYEAYSTRAKVTVKNG